MFIQDIPPSLLPENDEWSHGLPEDPEFYWAQLASRGVPWKECAIELIYCLPGEGVMILRPTDRLTAEFFNNQRLRDYAVRYIKAMPTTQRRSNGK